MSTWGEPCWHCGNKVVHFSCNYFEGKQEGRYCCYDYPRCKPNFEKTSPLACDICNRDNVKTYIIVFEDKPNGSRFCAMCISDTNGLRNTSNIIIIDENLHILTHDLFSHPSMCVNGSHL